MIYLIAKKCQHWSAEKNLRFRLARFECDSWDDIHDVPGAIWDAKKREWGDFYRIVVRGNWEFVREATNEEIMETKQQELAV